VEELRIISGETTRRTAATSRRVPPPRCIPLDGVVKTVSCQSRRRDPIMKFGRVFRRRRFATLLGITVYTPAPDLAPNVSQTSARVRRRRVWIALNRLRACTVGMKIVKSMFIASIEYRFNLGGPLGTLYVIINPENIPSRFKTCGHFSTDILVGYIDLFLFKLHLYFATSGLARRFSIFSFSLSLSI